ncbi:hypothetical protein CC86DRAFT_370404 [Ophiobolus disseminans]|uniref:CID domain-containing protein n=1 Tax=Ophiobolus disseminans TaxID=1469910 RepID=A0A6A6ZZU2_9PLEO|nr:hypothetical protein CC86DRAFT_370404 [Ophiobolus disseminans]
MSLPAAHEVAADFRDALQDLRVNSRPEISNLTLIAKENTEYAQAISTELEQHIRTTRPDFKLPALYVLDSIVKNVGTPYTVYLGRSMYKTFMDAYLVMDQGTRKAMEGLLKTWKQPVPESMDPRPVFPADVTRDIENSLMKMRSATQQHALPARPPTVPTPIPPPTFPFPFPPPPNLQFSGGWMPPAHPNPPAAQAAPVVPVASAAPRAPELNLAVLLAQLNGARPAAPPIAAPIIAPIIAPIAIAPTSYAKDSPEGIRGLFSTLKLTPPDHVVANLYDAKPNKCSTCGRRFENTPEGRTLKADHMDWHFKVNDPAAKKRAIHRSWYLNEQEWIDHKENEEIRKQEPEVRRGTTKPQYVSVPQDPTGQHAPCAICQEHFETQWNVEANDFVWIDAKRVGNKVYHASCFEETSVLGKRKFTVV